METYEWTFEFKMLYIQNNKKKKNNSVSIFNWIMIIALLYHKDHNAAVDTNFLSEILRWIFYPGPIRWPNYQDKQHTHLTQPSSRVHLRKLTLDRLADLKDDPTLLAPPPLSLAVRSSGSFKLLSMSHCYGPSICSPSSTSDKFHSLITWSCPTVASN